MDAAEEQRRKVVWWSRFRRSHQARAKRCHTQRRAYQAPPVAHGDALSEPICLPALPQLTDALWEPLRPLFEPVQPKRGRPTDEWRRRVEAVLWVARTAGTCVTYPKSSDRGKPWCIITAAGVKTGFGCRSFRFCSRKAPLTRLASLSPLLNGLSGAVVQRFRSC